MVVCERDRRLRRLRNCDRSISVERHQLCRYRCERHLCQRVQDFGGSRCGCGLDVDVWDIRGCGNERNRNQDRNLRNPGRNERNGRLLVHAERCRDQCVECVDDGDVGGDGQRWSGDDGGQPGDPTDGCE